MRLISKYVSIQARNIKSGRRQVEPTPVCPTPSITLAQRTGAQSPDRGAIIPIRLSCSQPGEVTQIIFFGGLGKMKRAAINI